MIATRTVFSVPSLCARGNQAARALCRIRRVPSEVHGKSVLSAVSARSSGFGDGIIGQAQRVEDESDIAGELGDGGGDAVAAVGFDQAGGETAQACDVLRAVAGAQGAAVFVPVPVENVVMGFNASVMAVEGEESSGIGALGGMVGQAIDGFGGDLAGRLLEALARDGEGLSDEGKVQRVVEPGGGPGRAIPGARAPE
jgi:hypothetical protein